MIWNMPIGTFLMYHGASWGGAALVLIYILWWTVKDKKRNNCDNQNNK
jgi:hypothetical protein